jgi:hypothetical protein
MFATGIPGEVAFLLVPTVAAISGVWVLGWSAVKSFHVEGSEDTDERSASLRPGLEADAAPKAA